MSSLIPIIGLGVILFGFYAILPKKPFTYDGRQTDQKSTNEMRNLIGGILILFFVIVCVAML